MPRAAKLGALPGPWPPWPTPVELTAGIPKLRKDLGGAGSGGAGTGKRAAGIACACVRGACDFGADLRSLHNK